MGDMTLCIERSLNMLDPHTGMLQTNKHSPQAGVPVSSGEDAAAELKNIAALPYVSPIICLQISFPQRSHIRTLEFCFDSSLFALFSFSDTHKAQR